MTAALPSRSSRIPKGNFNMKPFHAVLAASAVAASALAFGTNAVAADKPPVVLVHGAFEDAQIWGHVSARLKADGYQVVTVDLPGRPGAPAIGRASCRERVCQ